MPMAIWWVAGFVAVLLVLLPHWGYSGKWQHNLGSAVGIILIICLVLIVLGRIKQIEKIADAKTSAIFAFPIGPHPRPSPSARMEFRLQAASGSTTPFCLPQPHPKLTTLANSLDTITPTAHAPHGSPNKRQLMIRL